MHPLGPDSSERLADLELAPIEERASRYLTLHAELLAALEPTPR